MPVATGTASVAAVRTETRHTRAKRAGRVVATTGSDNFLEPAKDEVQGRLSVGKRAREGEHKECSILCSPLILTRLSVAHGCCLRVLPLPLRNRQASGFINCCFRPSFTLRERIVGSRDTRALSLHLLRFADAANGWIYGCTLSTLPDVSGSS